MASVAVIIRLFSFPPSGAVSLLHDWPFEICRNLSLSHVFSSLSQISQTLDARPTSLPLQFLPSLVSPSLEVAELGLIRGRFFDSSVLFLELGKERWPVSDMGTNQIPDLDWIDEVGGTDGDIRWTLDGFGDLPGYENFCLIFLSFLLCFFFFFDWCDFSTAFCSDWTFLNAVWRLVIRTKIFAFLTKWMRMRMLGKG